jgi:hypothetical protein
MFFFFLLLARKLRHKKVFEINEWRTHVCDEMCVFGFSGAMAIFYYYQFSYKLCDVHGDCEYQGLVCLIFVFPALSLTVRWARSAVNIITFYYVLEIFQILWPSAMAQLLLQWRRWNWQLQMGLND